MPDDKTISHEMPKARIIAVSICLFIIGYAVYTGSNSVIQFNDAKKIEPTSFFINFFLIALFVERGIEMFMHLWLGAKRMDLEHDLKDAELALTLDATKTKDVLKATISLDKYGDMAKRVALWSSFIIGLALSYTGVRCLEPLFKGVSEGHYDVFMVLDMLLTGAMIAGGSEGIHKFTSTIQTFLDVSKKKAKAKTP